MADFHSSSGRFRPVPGFGVRRACGARNAPRRHFLPGSRRPPSLSALSRMTRSFRSSRGAPNGRRQPQKNPRLPARLSSRRLANFGEWIPSANPSRYDPGCADSVSVLHAVGALNALCARAKPILARLLRGLAAATTSVDPIANSQ